MPRDPLKQRFATAWLTIAGIIASIIGTWSVTQYRMSAAEARIAEIHVNLDKIESKATLDHDLLLEMRGDVKAIRADLLELQRLLRK